MPFKASQTRKMRMILITLTKWGKCLSLTQNSVLLLVFVHLLLLKRSAPDPSHIGVVGVQDLKGHSSLLGYANFVNRLTYGFCFCYCDAAYCGIHWVTATLEQISSMATCGVIGSVVCTSTILYKTIGPVANTQ